MMSSVIPARLQFQCGHAALVTLPRVKGETATQRNDRVAREKSAALARQCDFCAPAVEVVVNGNHLVAAEVALPESVVAETELLAVVEPFVSEVPVVVVAVEPAESILGLAAAEIESEAAAELEAVEAEIAAEIEAEAEAELEAVEAEVEAVIEAVEAEIEAEAVAELEAEVAAAVESLLTTQPETPVNGAVHTPAAPAKRRAPVTTRRARTAEVIRGRRFLVEYRLERVVRAVDIHDALRQASSLGASQLTAITRED